MIMLPGIVGSVSGRLLNVGLLGFAAGIWVYTKGLCPLEDFGLNSMDFYMVMQKNGAPWSFKNCRLMPLV
jgi:hypothetical protein